ncbi:MAG: DHHA2 domain-containing protein, partial [Mycoplasmatales bacterium]
NVFESNFNTKLLNDKVMLDGVVSRKKQIVPFL